MPFFIILKEPDLGTAMVILLTGFGTLFLIGVNRRIWITLGLVVAFLAPVAYVVDPLKDYQKRRIMDFISDKSPYQVNQSLIAIGASGFLANQKRKQRNRNSNFCLMRIQTLFLRILSSDLVCLAHLGYWHYFLR